MDIQKLFETQRVLKDRVVDEKGLEGQDLLPEKILALHVELGELANEWRGFKFWSEDRVPRTKVKCSLCGGHGEHYQPIDGYMEMCPVCEGDGVEENRNPLLEEYVDCLHFILSIGLEINFDNYELIGYLDGEQETTETFLEIFETVSIVKQSQNRVHYSMLFEEFLYLGKQLGFTWEHIKQAYYAKSQINHERQATGY